MIPFQLSLPSPIESRPPAEIVVGDYDTAWKLWLNSSLNKGRLTFTRTAWVEVFMDMGMLEADALDLYYEVKSERYRQTLMGFYSPPDPSQIIEGQGRFL